MDSAVPILVEDLNGEDVPNIEGLRCTQDGKKQEVLVTLSALKNESGEIVAVATIAKDITELKAAEWFDPEQASENNREDTLEFLKRALKLMEGTD